MIRDGARGCTSVINTNMQVWTSITWLFPSSLVHMFLFLSVSALFFILLLAAELFSFSALQYIWELITEIQEIRHTKKDGNIRGMRQQSLFM